jgi:hypothetical protein
MLRGEEVDPVHDRDGLPILGHFQAACSHLIDHIVVHRHHGRRGPQPKDDVAHAEPSSTTVILMAKSDPSRMQGQHALVSSVCQSASSRENDVASGINSDQEANYGLMRSLE